MDLDLSRLVACVRKNKLRRHRHRVVHPPETQLVAGVKLMGPRVLAGLGIVHPTANLNLNVVNYDDAMGVGVPEAAYDANAGDEETNEPDHRTGVGQPITEGPDGTTERHTNL